MCDDTNVMELGKIIRQLRKRKALNQDELAFRTGTTAANISRIENDKHEAGPDLLDALAKEFDMKVYQVIALAEGVESPEIPSLNPIDEETLLAYFEKMTMEQKALFCQFAKMLVDKQ